MTSPTKFYHVIQILDVLMWPKFGNCSISMREVITTSILYGFDQRNHFFWRLVLVQVQQFRTGTRCKLEVLHQCCKRVKTESQKVLWANSYVCRSYRGKTGRVWGFLPPSWIGLKTWMSANCYSLSGTKFHILGPKFDKLSVHDTQIWH